MTEYRYQFLVELPEGKFLGRFTLSSPLGPVPRGCAYSYTREEADTLAQLHRGTVKHFESVFPETFSG